MKHAGLSFGISFFIFRNHFAVSNFDDGRFKIKVVQFDVAAVHIVDISLEYVTGVNVWSLSLSSWIS